MIRLYIRATIKGFYLSLLLLFAGPVVAIEVINTVNGSTRQLTGADNLALFQAGQGSALASSYGLDIQTGACLQCLPGEVIKDSPLDNTAEWLAQSPLIQEALQNVASPKMSGLDFDLLLAAAGLANLAYFNQAQQQSLAMPASANLSPVQYSARPAYSLFKIQQPTPTYFLTVTGTSNLEDWGANIDAAVVAGNYSGKAHQGFVNRAEQIKSNLPALVLQELRSQQAYLVITGHSMGGAVAKLLTVMLYHDGVPAHQLQTYVYAAPPIADSAFIDAYQDKLQIYNILTTADPVRLIAPATGAVSVSPNTVALNQMTEAEVKRLHALGKPLTLFHDGPATAGIGHSMYEDYLATLITLKRSSQLPEFYAANLNSGAAYRRWLAEFALARIKNSLPSMQLPLLNKKAPLLVETVNEDVLALLIAPKVSSPSRTLVALIDSSGSMQQTDPKRLRVAALEQLALLAPDNLRIAVVEFNSSARTLLPASLVGPWGSETRQGLVSQMNRLTATGGTNTLKGLELASQFAGGEGEILLLGDGQDAELTKHIATFAPGVKHIHTLALSAQADIDTLSKLAHLTGGYYEYADTAATLAEAITNILAQGQYTQELVSYSKLVRQGERIILPFWVEPGVASLNVSQSFQGSNADLTLVSPNGTSLSIHEAIKKRTGVEAATYDVIRIEAPAAGQWQAHSLAVQMATPQLVTMKVTTTDAAVQFAWLSNDTVPEVGRIYTVVAQSEADIAWLKVTGSLSMPDGTEQQIDTEPEYSLLFQQQQAEKQVWSTRFKQPGQYRLQLTLAGQLADGSAIQRSSSRMIEVRSTGEGLNDDRRLPLIPRRR